MQANAGENGITTPTQQVIAHQLRMNGIAMAKLGCLSLKKTIDLFFPPPSTISKIKDADEASRLHNLANSGWMSSQPE